VHFFSDPVQFEVWKDPTRHRLHLGRFLSRRLPIALNEHRPQIVKEVMVNSHADK
jgi:hypothetical protein